MAVAFRVTFFLVDLEVVLVGFFVAFLVAMRGKVQDFRQQCKPILLTKNTLQHTKGPENPLATDTRGV